MRDDQLAWAHLNADHSDTSAWLRREVGYLNDFVKNALLVDETRPRISPVGDGVLLALPGVNLKEDVRKFVLSTQKMFVVSNKLLVAEAFNEHTVFASVALFRALIIHQSVV